MLTLLFAYGAYRNARQARKALDPAPLPADAAVTTVAYGLALFFLWPLVLPAALIRYVPQANPGIALATPLPMLLSLLLLGKEFYFVYSLLFVIVGLNFVIAAFSNIEKESSSNV
jgi:hypothetical protein